MVARSRALAEDASELIEIDIQGITPVADRAASARDAHLLFEQNGTNTAAHYVVSIGDPDAAFAGADYVRARVSVRNAIRRFRWRHAACSRNMTPAPERW